MSYCHQCKTPFKGRHNCPSERQPSQLLANHLHVRMEEAGLRPDVYDADFIMGVIYEWLERHDAIISGTVGVMKKR